MEQPKNQQPVPKFKLSILIPTLPVRISTYVVLLNNIRDQIKKGKFESDVEILSLMDCKSMTIGDKRNRLIEMSSGEYIVFIDDDDNVPDYYISEVLSAIKESPDCVGIRGVIKYEGDTKGKDTVFIHSLRYPQDEDINIYAKGRPPNHLNPIKREIACTVKFPNQNWAEDIDWSSNLYFKLKTEKMIDRVMYVYFAYGSKSQSSPNCKLSHI